MYRCQICNKQSQPHQSKLRHVVKKPDGNIKEETQVCVGCFNALQAGIPLKKLLADVERFTVPRPVPVPAVINPPSPVGQPATQRDSLN